MLKNIIGLKDAMGIARKRGRPYLQRTVPTKKAEDAVSEGWEIVKSSKKSTRLKKMKSHDVYLEDRVWTLFYKMGFLFISGAGEAILLINPEDSKSPQNKIDVVGIDSEVAIAVECKSSEIPRKRPNFQEELAKHALIRENFTKAVRKQFQSDFKRNVALVMVLNNAILSDVDKERADAQNIKLFDQDDLFYYEELIRHLGPAARYQFLSEILPGKTIEGLSIRVPALKTKIGGYNTYTFAVPPDYLLKIGYISHRAKGKVGDVNTYQRMVKKPRLKKIRDYILNDGIFPTNIVINIEKSKKMRFERAKQEGSIETSIFGWLDLSPSYKTAWIIDGQHRLFAYSGMEEATKHKLSVIAFEGLPTRMQAKLFVDINAEQKSVKQNLLRELYAELRWDDEDPETRVSAIVSKAIQDIAIDPESPFFRRILLSDEQKTSDCCITLDSMAKALEKPGFFITIKKDIPKYDPLWRPDSLQCLKRTKSLLNGWFLILSTKADSWWRLGSGEGGGLAMNDGITICINVLRSVFKHLEDQGINLVQIDDQELLNCVNPYAEILGEYFYNLSEEKRKAFRSLRGVQGQTTGTKRCQVAINEKKPSFNPPGLKEFIETEKLETNKKAKEIIDRIERLTQETVIEELKSNYGEEDEKWWLNGVPRVVRTEATNRYEQDDGKRGGKEYYLDLIHYRKIIMEHWDLFESIFGYGEKSGKEKRTKWLADINDIRRVVAHSSAGAQVEPEKINELEEYERWLMLKTAGSDEFGQLE